MNSKRYIWLTDTHFNFLDKSSLIKFFFSLEEKQSDGIFITGDISTGPYLVEHLSLFGKIVKAPKYFVLGNHDFYRATFSEIENAMINLMKCDYKLHYLSTSDPISLSSDVALIGHDGWYDAGWRKPITPFIFIWDWFFIKDFRTLFGIKERMNLIRYRAAQATQKMMENLEKAFKTHSIVYMLTHVPPWPEESKKFYGLLEKFWMPYNSSKIMADGVSEIMKRYSDKKLIVLAGHSHIKRSTQISDNIEIKVGDAEFGKTQIQDIILI